ncbi:MULTISPECIES: aldo/keto reductase [Streptacidiphilus]|uniref:Aldo/keto reductase n=1 Tax=Streptacidiphilus cavernicola TaxID=3342716 RepID=A0ABV6UQY2_9ACTN|nr:aldo/keto reductase [Streptacidiphilus jeojiense]
MNSETITAKDSGTWKLGDLTVNRIGFGTMRLTQDGAALDPRAVPSDRGRALSVLRRAVELGVNHLDTASFYFSRLRSANELVNSALAPYPDDLVITTKVGPGRDQHGEWTDAATPDQLRGQVEENLRQLGRDHLDVVNYRRQRPGSIAEHFGALAELREAGLIRHLGLSNVGPEHLAEAQAIAPVVCVQNKYGLGAASPESDAFLRSCGEQGIAFVPFYAIAGHAGERGAAGAAQDAEVLAVAAAHGVSAAEIRLAWSLHLGPHVLAIPGTGNPAHLEANVAAGALKLSDEELARLDAVHRA